MCLQIDERFPGAIQISGGLMAKFKLEIQRGEEKHLICHGLMGGGNVTQM